MPKHPARLQRAGISKARYEMLKSFCRQYPEFKRALSRARAGIVDRPVHTSGAWHAPDPTGRAAMHLADHPAAKRVKLIEDCAAAVAEPVIAQTIVKSVSEGKGFDVLRPHIGEKQFYILRLLFYIELDRRMWETW